MADGDHDDSMPKARPRPGPPEAAPLGSWARLYALVCVLAVLVMALLWWFSAHYNLRLPKR